MTAMNALFWILWVINILALLMSIAGKGFRSDFGAGVDLNVLLIIVLVAVQVGSLFLRYSMKLKWMSVFVVSIPLLILMLWYVYEKYTGKTL